MTARPFATDLIDDAPRSWGELPAWIAGLDPEEAACVGAAAVTEAVAERGVRGAAEAGLCLAAVVAFGGRLVASVDAGDEVPARFVGLALAALRDRVREGVSGDGVVAYASHAAHPGAPGHRRDVYAARAREATTAAMRRGVMTAAQTRALGALRGPGKRIEDLTEEMRGNRRWRSTLLALERARLVRRDGGRYEITADGREALRLRGSTGGSDGD